MPDDKQKETSFGESETDHIQEHQKAVRRLLNYAITRPELDVQAEFIEKAIPILRKEAEAISEPEEIELMKIYNSLSKQLKPITNDSLIIAEKMKDNLYQGNANLLETSKKQNLGHRVSIELRILTLTLLVSVILFILLQTANQSLVEVVKQVDATDIELTNITQKIYDAKRIYEAKVSSDKNDSELAFLNSKKLEMIGIRNALSVSEGELTTQVTLCYPAPPKLFHRIYVGFCNNDKHNDNNLERLGLKDAGHSMGSRMKFGNAAIVLVHNDAKGFLMLINTYLIPLVLGGLGASACMVRHTLNGLSVSSYVISTWHKNVMRILLGSVLGVIGPVLLTTTRDDTMGINFSPFIIALLMGYSTEFAFSIFDNAIERAREWVNSSFKKSYTQIKTDK
jgi:hypothetical protein